MSGWGKKQLRSHMPKWLSEAEKDRTFLTEAGWMMMPLGSDNPATAELIVAMGMNDKVLKESFMEEIVQPEGFEDSIFGTVDTPIIPIVCEVSHLKDSSISFDSNFPEGLELKITSKTEFMIMGSPKAAFEGVTTVTIENETNRTQIVFEVEITE